MSTISPNMGLTISTINVDSGLTWEENLNSSLTLIDQHSHAPGYGVPITPTGLNINSDLSFSNNSGIDLKSIVFTPQLSFGTINSVYSIGADLYYNDGNSNVIQLTSGGTVNATSSGISSGSATASFVSSVLVVNAAANTPANIQGGSLLLGNNVAASKFLTLSPPSSMAANYSITLPSLPAQTNIMTLDTSGNIAGVTNVDNSTIEISANNLQVKDLGITAAKIANATITGTQVSSNINLAGKNVQEEGLNLVVSNTNPATNSLAIVRGSAGSGGGSGGEGFTSVNTGPGAYTITFTTSFLDTPAITANLTGNPGFVYFASISTSGATLVTTNTSGTPTTFSYNFIAIGQRV